jgi:HEAT repeat protein
LSRPGVKDASVVKALTEAMKATDPYVADAADSALRRLDPVARMGLEIARFREALKSRDKFVRCNAVQKLGGYGLSADRRSEDTAIKDAYQALFEALGDPDFIVRLRALQFISSYRDDFRAELGADTEAMVQSLQRAARDNNQSVREMAEQILTRERKRP